jgi:hypothetical protein
MALLAAPALSDDPPAIEVSEWSLTRLDLDITVWPGPRKLEMKGKARVKLIGAEAYGPVFGINTRSPVMQIKSMRSGGTAASIFPFKDTIEVALLPAPPGLKQGDEIDVEFEAESKAEGSQFVTTPGAFYASWVETWYPVPARKIDALSSPAAPGTMTFHLPKGWRSVSNGAMVDRIVAEDGAVTERWSVDTPAARSFAAAPYAVVEQARSGGREIGLFLLEPRPAIAAQANALAQSITAMERHFGPYPFSTYNVAEVPEGATFAASSEQGFIMVRSSLLDAEKGNLPLFAHEAAHGWWGNLVRGDGDGGRLLTESLAQFGALISIEEIEGKKAAAEFLRYSREGYSPMQSAMGFFYIWRQGGDKPLSKLSDGKFDHNLSDAKGHWFYHMLRHRLGDEAFFGMLRGLIETYRGRRATVDDLRQAIIAANPADTDLPNFVSQWIDRAGAPVLDVDWWSADRWGKTIELRIVQRQQELFDVPLEVAIDTQSGEVVRTTIRVNERNHAVKLPLPSRAVGVRLDPDDKLLFWRPEYGERPI